MASKTFYIPGPDYRHLVGSRIHITLESEQTSTGVIREQVQSSVRGDNLLVALDVPITSPSGMVYSTILIATRGDSLLSFARPSEVYISVSSHDATSHFTPATTGLATLL